MNFVSKILTIAAIMCWIYLNLDIFFPFIIKFFSGFTSIVKIIGILFCVGILSTMNNKIGFEYRATLLEKNDQIQVKQFGIYLSIVCLFLVSYFIAGAWMSSIKLGWEHYHIQLFNKILFTSFCLSTLSIPSNIKINK